MFAKHNDHTGLGSKFNAPIGNWDVSKVTTMAQSEYIRVCGHNDIMLCTVFLLNA